ncbi:MAG TPA: hypothetical protein ENI71_00840, partial [Chromatiales bacterium]|nr:hypothetical protein [Chromatiales bacterium]
MPRSAGPTALPESRALEPGRLWRRITLLFVSGGVLVLAVFAVWSWRQTFDRINSKLAIEVTMAANGVDAILSGLGNDLPYLGGQLPAHAQGDFRARSYALL